MNPETAFSSQQYDEAYPDGIEKNFWNLARNALVCKAVRHLLHTAGLSGDSLILDVGCGPGIVVSALRADGLMVEGVELAKPEPLASARSFLHLHQSVFDLPADLRSRVRIILLLDVIEHIQQPVEFIKALQVACPNLYGCVVTVPARQEVWSNYDEHYGHFRRYNRPLLVETLTDAGMTPDKPAYIFGLLYGAARLFTLLKCRRALGIGAPRALRLHRFLALYFDLEARVMSWMPWQIGLSLIVSARVRKGE